MHALNPALKVEYLLDSARKSVARGDSLSAEEALLTARDEDSGSPAIYLELAELAMHRRQYPVAMQLLRLGLAYQPQNVEAWARLGNACWRAQKYDESFHALLQAEQLAPGSKLVDHNLGLLWYFRGNADQAMRHLENALKLAPQDKWIKNDYAHAVLKSGDLKRGLKLFEARWDILEKSPVWQCGLPVWQGETCSEKTLLLHAEQGYGDTLQFIQFIPEIKEHGQFKRIVFAGPVTLRRLLAGQCEIDDYVDFTSVGELLKAVRGSDPAFVHCPLISAFSHLGYSYDTMVPPVPYLTAPATSPRPLRPGGTKFAVGIVWAASVGHERSRQRSVPVTDLLPLSTIPGVRLWSLQMAPHAKEAVETGADLVIGDATVPVMDFADTAAIIQDMDAIVTVDTAIVHLAGALGKRTFMLNPFNACWRWVHGADPWYSSVSLVQQSQDLSWVEAIDEVKIHIAELVRKKGQ
jgi:tetratricopeptide repeat protein/glycosyl transferase family 9 (putative heptosyltransferase)